MNKTYTVPGPVQAGNSAEMESALEALVKEPSQKITLDLSHADYLTAAGLRVIHRFAILLHQDRPLAISGARPDVADLLQLAGLHHFTHITHVQEATT